MGGGEGPSEAGDEQHQLVAHDMAVPEVPGAKEGEPPRHHEGRPSGERRHPGRGLAEDQHAHQKSATYL